MTNTEKILIEQGRTRKWLAKRINLHEVTLSNKLNPKNYKYRFTEKNYKDIAEALGVPVDLL